MSTIRTPNNNSTPSDYTINILLHELKLMQKKFPKVHWWRGEGNPLGSMRYNKIHLNLYQKFIHSYKIPTLTLFIDFRHTQMYLK